MQASSTIDFTNILTFVGWLTVRGGRLSVMVVFAVDVYLYYFQLLMALVQSCNDLVFLGVYDGDDSARQA